MNAMKCMFITFKCLVVIFVKYNKFIYFFTANWWSRFVWTFRQLTKGRQWHFSLYRSYFNSLRVPRTFTSIILMLQHLVLWLSLIWFFLAWKQRLFIGLLATKIIKLIEFQLTFLIKQLSANHTSLSTAGPAEVHKQNALVISFGCKL